MAPHVSAPEPLRDPARTPLSAPLRIGTGTSPSKRRGKESLRWRWW